jgi:hypothetical protein
MFCILSTESKFVMYTDGAVQFFPVEAIIPIDTGISAFTVTINLKNGSSLFFDNNGHTYPMQDATILLHPQSCLLQGTGVFSGTMAVRNDRNHLPTKMRITYKQPRPGLPVSALITKDLEMQKGDCVGLYTLYSTNWTIPGGLSYAAKIDAISGEGDNMIADDFNNAVHVPGHCTPLKPPEKVVCKVPVVSSVQISMTPAATPSMTFYDAVHPTMVTKPSSAAAKPTAVAQEGEATVPKPISEQHDIHIGTAFSNFFHYFINYIVNFFFGYVSCLTICFMTCKY